MKRSENESHYYQLKSRSCFFFLPLIIYNSVWFRKKRKKSFFYTLFYIFKKMQYRSTRGQAKNYSFEEAVMTGLGPDGGLFIPQSIPTLPSNWREAWANYSFQQLAVEILSLYIDETEICRKDLTELVNRSYATFRSEDVTPLFKVRDGLYVMELFHGPTFAFKDVALQFVGNLFEYFLERKNRNETEAGKTHRLTVVGATSGDTGR